MSSPSSYVRDRKSENERQLLDRRNGRPCPGHPAKHPSDGTVTKTSAALNVRNWAATHRSHFRAQPHASACQGRLSSACSALPVQAHALCPMPHAHRHSSRIFLGTSPVPADAIYSLDHLPSWSFAILAICLFAFFANCPLAHLLTCRLAYLRTCSFAFLGNCHLAHLITCLFAFLLSLPLARYEIYHRKSLCFQYFGLNFKTHLQYLYWLFAILPTWTNGHLPLHSQEGCCIAIS